MRSLARDPKTHPRTVCRSIFRTNPKKIKQVIESWIRGSHVLSVIDGLFLDGSPEKEAASDPPLPFGPPCVA